MLLAPATQSAPPQCQQSLSERREAVEVSWYRIVVEVALHDRSEPSSRVSYGIMHASLKLLLKLPQFAPHALADRFASHGEVPQSILPADVPKQSQVPTGTIMSRLWPFPQVRNSGHIRFNLAWVRAAWVKCIARGIHDSGAMSPSRF